MAYDLKPLKEKLSAVSEWLRKELSGIRTGRATSAILDNISVDSYGAKMHIRELASIGTEDPRTLRINPYDAAQTKSIEKAIVQSNLGLSVAADDRGIRVIFPELTAERRESYLKLAKERLEEARKKMRGVRDEVWKDIQTQEREKKMREDDKFRLKDELQKEIDSHSRRLDDLFSKKESEIRS